MLFVIIILGLLVCRKKFSEKDIACTSIIREDHLTAPLKPRTLMNKDVHGSMEE